MKKSCLLLFTYFMALQTVLQAQVPCALDNSFNSNGRLVTDGSRICDRVVALPNGEALVVYNPFGTGHAYVRRLLANGATDNTYGTNGKTTIQVASSTTTIKGTLLHNNQLYLCGSTSTGTNTYPFVACLKSNGLIDSSFGNSGIVSFSTFYTFNDMILEPGTNKFLVAGMKGVSTATITRLHPSGFMDATFGNLGSTNIQTAATGIYYEIRDIQLDKNNNILITGKHYTTQGSSIYTQLTVMRFLPDGTLDNSFDSDGKAYYNSGTGHYDEGVRIFANSANDYYIAGATYNGFNWDYTLLRIKPSGLVDAGFGAGGWKLYDLTSNNKDEYPLNAAMMPNEHILITGNQGSGDTVHFSLLMIKPDGSTDQTFAPNGLFMNIFGVNNNNSSAGLAVTQEGKIYLAGYTRTCQNGTCGPLYGGIARYVGAPIGSASGILATELSDLQIYPNPLSADATFSLSGLTASTYHINVLNSLGERVPVKQLGDFRYQLEQPTPGMYFVHIVQGNSYGVRKIILE